MKNSYFTNENQLHQWIEAAEGIEERFGLEKALGYLIGEKFYNIVSDNHFARKMIRIIADERKQPDYNPIREYGEGKFKKSINLDEQYKAHESLIIETEQILIEFTKLVKDSFDLDEIKSYFDSNPRLGAHGHTTSEEQHDFLIQHGAIEHSIETEVKDALILGDMMKYLQIS
jgi:hypothetical protein